MPILSKRPLRLPRVAPEVWLATAVALAALLVRLHGLGDKPLWLDEVTSLRRATMPVADLVGDSLRRKHDPAYFLLLWLVAHWGTSQGLLRLPSAVFAALAAGLTAAIGARVAGLRSGLAAGLLMALAPFDVQLGQEARSYELVACLILAALAGLAALARAPATAGVRWRDGACPRGAWLAYALGTAAALNVLSVALFWLVASNLGALAIARDAGEARGAFLRRWAVVQGLIVVAWLPGLIAILAYAKPDLMHGSNWEADDARTISWAILGPVYLLRASAFITLDVAPAAVPGLGILVAAAAVMGAWQLRRERALLATLAASALVVPLGAAALGLGLLHSGAMPILVPRYYAWCMGPYFILAGIGLGRLQHARFGAASAALALALAINLTPYYRAETKPRWDLAAAMLAKEARPGDVVLLDNYSSYYVLSAFAAGSGLDRRGLTFVWERARAAELARGHGLWAVYGRVGQGELKPAAAYLETLASLGTPVSEQAIGRYIVLWRLDRTRHSAG